MWKIGLAGLTLAASALAQVTQRVSVNTQGYQADSGSLYPSVSGDGRYVAFYSNATNLVPIDTKGLPQIYVRDRWTGTTEIVSTNADGDVGNNLCEDPRISADGRYVAFGSQSTNYVPNDTNNWSDIFVFDRVTRSIERVNVATDGTQANDYSAAPSLSDDGRFVAFYSGASNLSAEQDLNGAYDVFVHDRLLRTTQLVSVAIDGRSGDQGSDSPAISGDGRCIAFQSHAFNLVPHPTILSFNVYVRDMQAMTTEQISVGANGAPGGSAGYPAPGISNDGRFVAFASGRPDLVPSDTNGAFDVFVRDRSAQTTERVSVGPQGQEGNDYSGSGMTGISSEGRFVLFDSYCTNLVEGDTNGLFDVFVHDRQTGSNDRVNVSSAGTQADGYTDSAEISADGRYVSFDSTATTLVSNDVNGDRDIFVRDRTGGPSFLSICSPGHDGVVECPCGNVPAARGSGCDNSSSTGGATLLAVGGSYLSSDSLMFRTSGERPTSLSIVMQGNGLVSGGHIYGQGVRCLGGTIIRRLFIKHALGGSITAPELDGGDLTVSARSAAKGDSISAGESRYYLVYYRDPIVLGGCPASSTFNATQTGVVSWAP